MWKWLEAVSNYDRLTAENKELRQEITRLNEQLFTEIDSNREREDELIGLLSGGQDVGRRRNQLVQRPEMVDDAPAPREPELTFGVPDKHMVHLRARDYMAEAAKAGIYYDFEELCKAIESNPQEYLSN